MTSSFLALNEAHKENQTLLGVIVVVVVVVPIEAQHILQIDQIEADKEKEKDEYHDAIQ